jgi:hypothetical protein
MLCPSAFDKWNYRRTTESEGCYRDSRRVRGSAKRRGSSQEKAGLSPARRSIMWIEYYPRRVQVHWTSWV